MYQMSQHSWAQLLLANDAQTRVNSVLLTDYFNLWNTNLVLGHCTCGTN